MGRRQTHKRRKPRWIEASPLEAACPHSSRVYYPLFFQIKLSCNQAVTLVSHFKFLLRWDRTEEITHSPNLFTNHCSEESCNFPLLRGHELRDFRFCHLGCSSSPDLREGSFRLSEVGCSAIEHQLGRSSRGAWAPNTASPTPVCGPQCVNHWLPPLAASLNESRIIECYSFNVIECPSFFRWKK